MRTRLRLEDWARTRGLSGLTSAARLAYAALGARQRLCDAIAGFLVANPRVPWRRAWVRAGLRAGRRGRSGVSGGAGETILACGIVAKLPQSAAERGILFVSFEGELEKLVAHPNFASIEAEYQIVFLPTWQPAYSGALFRLAARATRPYVLLPASRRDLQLDAELGPLCIPLPLHAGSWVAPAQFPVRPKDIDLIIVANFAKYKRHWKLFEAVRQLKGAYRIVCAGRPWGGRDAAALRREAASFGVVDRIEFVTDPSDAEVAGLLARSRLFCALSHKEGAFIAAAEAMMAGTAVGMFDDAIIGSKDFVNEHTGVLFDSVRPLGPQLQTALARTAALQPHRWAREHIAADVSMRRFNDAMRRHSARRGLPWTQDAVAIHSRNFAFYYGEEADAPAFADAYARLRQIHHVSVRGHGAVPAPLAVTRA